MQELTYTKELTETGLSPEEAQVYETVLRMGESQASAIARELPLSRTLVYKLLDMLIAKSLVEKDDPKNAVATFVAKHPIGITQSLETQKKDIDATIEKFGAITGSLTSLYNLTSGKPGIQFYEGEDGVWTILKDTLTSKEEIRTYADLEAIDAYIPEINERYSNMREKRNVKKRGIVLDSPAARKFLESYDGHVTTTKLIKAEHVPFQTIMQIYDQKISYLTLTDRYFVGIIITDEHIADMHKYLFDSMWEMTPGQVVEK